MPGSYEHVLQSVDAYLHELLRASERDRLERHVEECRICQVALDEARKRFAALHSLPIVEAPERLLRETEQRIRECRAPRLSAATICLLTGAAAALLLGCAHVYYLNLSPAPNDLRVLGQSELLAGADGALRVVVMRHADQTPVAGVDVEIELAGPPETAPVRLASFRTDSSGTGAPRFRWPDWAPGPYELRVRAQSRSQRDEIRRPVTLKRSWKLMVTSDKPVYQPGQTIRLRTLGLRRPDLKPVAGEETTISIADPKGNVIFRQRGVTSRFGITSADCPLADEIIEGTYQVTCEMGDTRGETTVTVQRYVLPRFKIEAEFDKPYYQPGERVAGRVTARYFFGKPVGDGEVEIGIPGKLGEQERSLRLRTDPSGTAEFEFVLPEHRHGIDSIKEIRALSLTFSIRDPAGQEQRTTRSCFVSAQPIQIDVIPEGGTLVAGVRNRVYVLTSYPDGQPAPARLAISGQPQEFATDDLGVAVVELNGPAEDLRWTLHATDREGREGGREFTFERSTTYDDFLVRTDKATCRGGETLHITALGNASREPVFVDLIKDGQTVLTQVLTMTDGRGEWEFDLPPELFGTIELCAYRYGSDGIPLRKRRVLYVDRAQDLRIDVSQSAAEYRPGERARLTLRLTGPQGAPVPGAFSLSAVDEAVYSVLDQKPGRERTFFSLEQELLQPVLAAYPWLPGERRDVSSESQARFEQAQFARAAGGDRDGREALMRKLLPYADNDPRMFDVLQRPDWEQIVERLGTFPPKLVEQLRGTAGVHSLSATTYVANLHAVEQQRAKGRVFVKGLWMALVIVGLVVLVILSIRTIWEVLVLVLIVMTLIALMLPAVQQAREAARRTQARSDLKQIELAFANANEAQAIHVRPGDVDRQQPAGPRLRQWFPETLLWRPELITDDNGEAVIDVDLADSITTWRLSASAVSAAGELGSLESAVRVFQPFFVDFNLPVALTRGDAVTVPVVVYNYLDRPQTVQLTLDDAPAFERVGPAGQSIELAAGEVKSVGYRLVARKAGRQALRIAARAGEVADAVERSIEVVPDGQKSELIASGTLSEPARQTIEIPKEAIEGSVKATLKVYPSNFSQLVEGLDGIFLRPSGCFEQTSSTTYPNVLALDYLIRMKKNAPDVEARARQYIHLGYQRLLTFEIDGGGFDWFGRPPANRVLSAYGLMEFEDMARVHDVDRSVIERTRKWLLSQQRHDGIWAPEGHLLHEDPTGGDRRTAELATTAYIAWAVFGGEVADRTTLAARKAREYLVTRNPATIDDPYVLALVANAIAAIDRSSDSAAAFLNRLDSLRQSSPDGKRVWWQADSNRRTLFYGGGISRRVEATAMASLALMHSGGRHGATLRGALAWLAEQKDAHGTWHSTQATVLALKALLAATERPLGEAAVRQIEISIDGKPWRTIDIPRDQFDVLQQVDLTSQLSIGSHEVVVVDRSGQRTGYQLAVSWHTSDPSRSPDPLGLSISLEFDKRALRVGESTQAKAIVRNDSGEPVPMVLVDLPIPAGFEVDPAGIAQMVADGTIEKFQVTARSVIVYLRSLDAGGSLTIPYTLRATIPAELTTPAAIAWDYYQPEVISRSALARLSVVDAAGP